jgi:hypothetical protein
MPAHGTGGPIAAGKFQQARVGRGQLAAIARIALAPSRRDLPARRWASVNAAAGITASPRGCKQAFSVAAARRRVRTARPGRSWIAAMSLAPVARTTRWRRARSMLDSSLRSAFGPPRRQPSAPDIRCRRLQDTSSMKSQKNAAARLNRGRGSDRALALDETKQARDERRPRKGRIASSRAPPPRGYNEPRILHSRQRPSWARDHSGRSPELRREREWSAEHWCPIVVWPLRCPGAAACVIGKVVNVWWAH